MKEEGKEKGLEPVITDRADADRAPTAGKITLPAVKSRYPYKNSITPNFILVCLPRQQSYLLNSFLLLTDISPKTKIFHIVIDSDNSPAHLNGTGYTTLSTCG